MDKDILEKGFLSKKMRKIKKVQYRESDTHKKRIQLKRVDSDYFQDKLLICLNEFMMLVEIQRSEFLIMIY